VNYCQFTLERRMGAGLHWILDADRETSRLPGVEGHHTGLVFPSAIRREG
jgi:hypothetical protein